MKTTKSLFIALASLSLFACSQEEINNGQVAVEGNAALTIKIDTESLSRAVGDATVDGTKKISLSNLVVRFVGSSESPTYKIDSPQGTVTIYNIPEGTTGVAIVGNTEATGTDGDNNSYNDAFSSTSEAESNKDNPVSGATVYGFSDNFVADGTINGSGDGSDDTQGDANVAYAKYTVNVTVKPVAARLEVGQISFTAGKPSDFTKLTVTDAFLNGAYMSATFSPTEYKITPDGYSILTASNITDGWSSYPLKDNFADNNVIYGEGNVPAFPANTKYIGYNFFVNASQESDNNDTGKSLPKFTLKLTPEYSGSVQGPSTLYAVIAKYKNSSNQYINSFVPGKVYKIESISLPEDVLTPDPSGNQTIAVVATVSVQDWTLETTTGEWAGQN